MFPKQFFLNLPHTLSDSLKSLVSKVFYELCFKEQQINHASDPCLTDGEHLGTQRICVFCFFFTIFHLHLHFQVSVLCVSINAQTQYNFVLYFKQLSAR